MGARAERSVREAQERFDAHVRSVAGTPEAPADQIQKAKALLTISQDPAWPQM